MLVVLDTSVLVAGARSRSGASFQLLSRIGTNVFDIAVSVPLVVEYEDVLKRDGMLPSGSEAEIDDFLDYIFKTSNLVPLVLRQRPSLRDPDDERILVASPNGGFLKH